MAKPMTANIIETEQIRFSKRVEEAIGKRFGKWTVIGFQGYAITPSTGVLRARMKCQCDCGVIKAIDIGSLMSGDTKSCGAHPRLIDRSLPAFNNLYRNSYKANALKRGLAWELSKEEFRQLIIQDCFYCGAHPSEIRRLTGKLISTLNANGVDRVDNSKGYIPGNVVPCCGACNHAKATLAQEEFILLANRIALMHPRSL